MVFGLEGSLAMALTRPCPLIETDELVTTAGPRLVQLAVGTFRVEIFDSFCVFCLQASHNTEAGAIVPSVWR